MIVAIVALKSPPRYTLLAWLLTIGFVPIWLGVNLNFYFMPGAVVGLLVLAAQNHARAEPITSHDVGIAAMFASVLIPFIILEVGTLTGVFVIVFQLGLAYLLGLLAPGAVSPDWMYRAISLVFLAVALLAILEFFLSRNPFVEIPGYAPLESAWSELQERGGIVRAQGVRG